MVCNSQVKQNSQGGQEDQQVQWVLCLQAFPVINRKTRLDPDKILFRQIKIEH